jgi:hypothetical protein
MLERKGRWRSGRHNAPRWRARPKGNDQHTRVSPKYTGLSTYSALFLLSLFALEALIVTYWVRLRLYQFLPIFLPLSVVSAYTGKLALSRK